MSELAANSQVRQQFPVISQALELSASAQLRNMASIGGNLMQRPRCLYFRDVSAPCNPRSPGSGCGAIGGRNRTHAILGISHQCVATHPSDLAVALTALDATIDVILWDSGTSEGIYSGAVGDDGIARGQAVDGKNPGQQASWQSIRALPCITAAGPTPGRPNDRDSDGLFDDDETNVYGTNPDVADTDGDGPDDGQEVFDGTDPLDPNDP